MASIATHAPAWPLSTSVRRCARARTVVAATSALAGRPSSSRLCRRRPAAPTTTTARGLRSTLAASLSRRSDQDDDDDDGDASSTNEPAAAIVVTGFSPEECSYCRGVLGLPLVAATPKMLAAPLEEQAALAAAELDAALVRDAAAEARAEAEQAEDEERGSEDSDESFFSSSSSANNNNNNNNGGAATTPTSATADPAALALGRTALFVGDPSFAAAYASSLNGALASAELWPAVVAASPPKHAQRPLRDALVAIREAHARRHRLVQPLRVDPSLAAIPPEPGATLVMNLEIDASDAVPVSATATAAAAAAAAAASTSGGASSPPPLLTRRDASRVVVLDGLITDDERAELFAAITAPGHDPALPPPSDKWEARLVDRAGEPPTWGLKASAIRSLLRDPPRALVALQSRLAALYPEYTICAMPAAAMRGGGYEDDDDDGGAGAGDASSPYIGGGDDDDDPAFTAPIVANAVAPGDPCAWHVDADPSLIPADAAFSCHFGPYVNREPGLPLFVSIMLYANAQWEEDWHAETLFIDPATGVGAFTSARPGRVVLMDQDISHRIGSPSAVRAPALRYSLVLKTVWIPKDGGLGLGSSGISRPEWGPPQALGSASRAIGPRGQEVVAAAAQ